MQYTLSNAVVEASTKISQNIQENLNTKDKDNMSNEWYYIQQWRYNREKREQEKKDKKRLNKKDNSTVEDT